MHKKLQGKLGGLAICICLVCMICSDGLAAQFQWYNDPNSTTDFTFFSRSCAQTASDPCTNNTIRLADIQAVNLIDQPLSDVGFFLAATWPRVFNPDGRARHLEEQVLEQRHADRLKARQTVVVEAEIVRIPQAGDNTRVEGKHTFPKLLLSS